MGLFLLVGGVEQTAAYFVDQHIWIHPYGILGEEIRMLLDEGDDIEGLLHRRLETAPAALGDDELVPAHPLPVLVETDIGRIAQTVLAVAHIPGIFQEILNREPLEVIVIRVSRHFFNLYRPRPTPCSAALIPASKARLAMSCGESTPGFM